MKIRLNLKLIFLFGFIAFNPPLVQAMGDLEKSIYLQTLEFSKGKENKDIIEFHQSLKNLDTAKFNSIFEKIDWSKKSFLNSNYLYTAGLYFSGKIMKLLPAIRALKGKLSESEHLLLGFCADKTGIPGYGLAISHFRKALTLNPQSPLARVALGHIFLKKNLLEAGKKYFEDTLKGDPGHLEATLGLASFHLRKGEKNLCLDYIAQTRSQHPDDERPYAAYGESLIFLYGNSRLPEAIENFRKSLNIAPNNPENLVKMSLAMLKMNYDFTASGYVKKAISLFPTHGRVLWMRGLFSEARGQLKEALGYFQLAMESRPGDPEVVFSMANLLGARPNTRYLPPSQNIKKRFYFRVQNENQAIKLFHEVLKLDRSFPYRNDIVAAIQRLENNLSAKEKAILPLTEEQVEYLRFEERFSGR